MKEFRKQMQHQLDRMVATGHLFRSSVSGHQIWDAYLDAFNEDPIFRDPESSTHNCQSCNNFIRRYGNIIALDKDYNIITLFDFVPKSPEFLPVNLKLQALIAQGAIQDVFFETYEELNSLPYESCNKAQDVFKLGIDKNVKRYTKAEADLYGVVSPNQVYTFEHMSLLLPREFVKRNNGSIEAIQSKYRDAKNVFKRGLDEISVDTLILVKDLINQGSLLDGATHLDKIESILPYAKQYVDVPGKDKDAWCWLNSYENIHAKFKNTLIGVLCSELSEGMELNKACENWNKRVDPINYMKATAPITATQIKEAKIFVEQNGYESSFKRRLATIDDIKADEILHLNSGDGTIKPVSIFDDVTPAKSTRHKKSEFDNVEEVLIEKFMKDILPGCTSVEVLLKSSHEHNMVTLTTAESNDSKPIFKWDNNYSWTFNGNLAGKSMIKTAVKSQGGAVDGVLRFSIMWAEDDIDDSDLDAHCIQPNGNEIYFSNKMDFHTLGNLDIDIINPQSHKRNAKKEVVENITWPSCRNMPSGTYKFFVHQYNNRQSKGFKAEIEFDGEIYSYEYPTGVRQSQNIQVAEVHYNNGEFVIEHKLALVDGFGSDKEVYGLETNQFHKVNLICLSPNYWGNNAIGNKHYFFMLEGAKCGVQIRSFHNENLKSDLVAHRKVMEVLANTTMVESQPKELSGLGFNATVKDEVILRLKGSHKRVIKVKF